MSNLDIYSFGGTQITVGVSAITKFSPAAFQRAETIKIVSGSGTLWLNPLTPIALSGTSAVASIGVGYPIGATEILNVGGPATFYLSATAGAMVVGLALGFTAGYTASI